MAKMKMNREELELLAEDRETLDGAAAEVLARVRREVLKLKPPDIQGTPQDIQEMTTTMVMEYLREMLRSAEGQGDRCAARVIRLAILKTAEI